MAASRKNNAGGVQSDGWCQTVSSTLPAAEMVKQMGVSEENGFHVKQLGQDQASGLNPTRWGAS
jgi:hypothetical protein